MHGGDEKCIHNFDQKNSDGRDHSEDPDVDRGIILECILNI
jgi:hypothetical protein